MALRPGARRRLTGQPAGLGRHLIPCRSIDLQVNFKPTFQ